MKITITTGIYPPDIGGPAEYARQLFGALLIANHDAKVVAYGSLKKIPTGLRHIIYFFKLFGSIGTDYIITLDTFSVGLPAVVFSKIFRKKIVIRVGGDFLWESYVNRTREMVFLSEFYQKKLKFSLKEKMIFALTGFVLRNCHSVVFNTEWQREIFLKPYRLDMRKTDIIENVFFPKEATGFQEKIFLSPARNSYIKNKRNLTNAFEFAKSGHREIMLDTDTVSHEVMVEKISKCYAVLAVSLSDVSPNLVAYALQYAKPVIMTRDTGLKNRLQNEVMFVNPLSVEEISGAIVRLLAPEVYQNIETICSRIRIPIR